MRKIFVVILGLMVISAANLSAQKKVEIYTKLKNASFIPYINDEQMTMIPVDTFVYEFDTVSIVNLTVHFPDSNVYDLSEKLNFNGIKYKKFEIVERPKVIKRVRDLTQRNKSENLDDKFMLRNKTFINYLNSNF